MLLINITKLLDLIESLMAEYKAEKDSGRSPSAIKVRIDCILKSLMSSIGTCLVGGPKDHIVEVDYHNEV